MNNDQDKIDQILQVLLDYTLMDFSKQIPFSKERDELDAIAVGVNSLGQELSHTLEQLNKKNKELEQIAFITSHDLREPLILINSFCEKLKQDYDGQLDDTADLYINYIYNAARRMSHLMEALVQYGSVNDNIPASSVNLNEIVDDVLRRYADTIEKANAKIAVEKLPTVQADPVEMDRMFGHLFSNALKFRKPGKNPEISLSVNSFENFWQFCIGDNGIGIEPQYHQKAFQIFRQLNSRDEFPGIGIGLSYCQKVVEKYGGEMDLESRPGEGSKFYFTIPKNGHDNE